MEPRAENFQRWRQWHRARLFRATNKRPRPRRRSPSGSSRLMEERKVRERRGREVRRRPRSNQRSELRGVVRLCETPRESLWPGLRQTEAGLQYRRKDCRKQTKMQRRKQRGRARKSNCCCFAISFFASSESTKARQRRRRCAQK